MDSISNLHFQGAGTDFNEDSFLSFYENSPSHLVDSSSSPVTLTAGATFTTSFNPPFDRSFPSSQRDPPEWQSQQEFANDGTGEEPPIVGSASELRCEPLALSMSSTSRRRYGPEVWIQFQPVVRDIYIIQGCTLLETQRILEEKYNFKASKKQLKDRVKKWGFVKNRKGGARSSSQGSNSLEPVNELEDSQTLSPLSPTSAAQQYI